MATGMSPLHVRRPTRASPSTVKSIEPFKISPMPTCWIIAGPNGAGKTTFALEYLPNVAGCQNFINADLIAAGLSPANPAGALISAGRLLRKEIETRIAANEDFAFETTLSGRAYLNLIEQLNSLNWNVELIYLALPSLAMSTLRVAERVRHGGHDVPKKTGNGDSQEACGAFSTSTC
jgi:predicted ABC-type ATPase